MKRFFIFLLAFLFLYSCSEDNKFISACQEEIKKSLKDPYSVVWEDSEAVEMPDDILQTQIIKVGYNAKNSYGAYIGKKYEYCRILPKKGGGFDVSIFDSNALLFDAIKNGKTKEELNNIELEYLKTETEDIKNHIKQYQ